MLAGLDIFSGIGGITEALSEWVRPVAYCECDRYAQAVLLSRMERGEIPAAPIWDDVRTLRGAMLPEIDIAYGGFPCQDISVAGNGAGLEGERSGLFFEVARLVRELRPRFVFLENVPAITFRGLGDVAATLAALRYDARWGMLSAYDMGAPHYRERWWLLAHARHASGRSNPTSGYDITRPNGDEPEGRETHHCVRECCEDVAHTKRLRELQPEGSKQEFGRWTSDGSQDMEHLPSAVKRRHWPESDWSQSGSTDSSWWSTEPSVGRVVNGLPFRSDRIKCLGNSVAPACAREAFKRLAGIN